MCCAQSALYVCFELLELLEGPLGWEVYKPERTITDAPAVTISSMGRVSLNKAAAKLFRSKRKHRVSFLWNRDIASVGIRPTDKQEDTYLLSSDAAITLTISCATFLNHIRYDWSQKRSFSASWDHENSMLVFQIPKEFLGALPLKRRRIHPI